MIRRSRTPARGALTRAAPEPRANKRKPAARRRPIALSIIITAYNEGAELLRTLESVRKHTRSSHEIIVVDDGSTDGSCAALARRRVTLIRHAERLGVASSRREACALARGSVLAFLDAHQRVEPGALDVCAQTAARRNAIVCPDIADIEGDERTHGAFFVLSKRQGCFAAEWKCRTPTAPLVPVSSLRAPAYLIPRKVYPKVGWSSLLRGWGGSEAAVSLKAFFAGVEILHQCGPLVRHRFKPAFHYQVSPHEVWRNHAIIARVCFDEATWRDYWLPRVFKRHLTAELRRELESDAIRAEHDEFSQFKARPDRDFWTELVFEPLPEALTDRRRPTNARRS